MYWFGSTSGACVINTSALEDDNYYLCTQIIGATDISMKMNKLTNVNNAIVIGSDINSTTTAKGTEELTGGCFGILSACYSNGTYNYASGNQMVYIEFLDANDNVLLSFNFSEGSGEQVFDIISGNAFAISNITVADFWNQTQDFNHYNFKNGFTLYQKTGEADIRIPNKKDGSEITPASIPNGYTRIANYKSCQKTFNQCENVFVLDNVLAGSTDLTVTNAGDTVLNGEYHVYDVYGGKNRYIDNNISSYTHFFNWDAGTSRWNWGVSGGAVKWVSSQDVATPDLVTVWSNDALTGTAPAGTITTQSPSDLYNADVDHFLFTESTGVAKELTIQNIDVDTGFDRGHLYINPNPNEKNFMFYKTDKTLLNDVKIIKYIGIGDEIVTDESGDVVYDENDHTILED